MKKQQRSVWTKEQREKQSKIIKASLAKKQRSYRAKQAPEFIDSLKIVKQVEAKIASIIRLMPDRKLVELLINSK